MTILNIFKKPPLKKIILTGFEPFGDYKWNPTEQSTKDLDGEIIGDRKVIGVVLPATYYAWRILMEKISELGDVYGVVSTGLSSSVKGMRIETTFQNLMWGKYPDANGFEPDGKPIFHCETTPFKITAKSNGERLLHDLDDKNVPAEISDDAHAFICNALGYVVSTNAHAKKVQRNIFVHVPWTSDYADKVSLEKGKVYLDKDLFEKGLRTIIKNI